MQLNGMIRAIKQQNAGIKIKLGVEFLESWLFCSLQFILWWRWTLMTSYTRKPSPIWLHAAASYVTRPTARQIVLHEGCDKKKLNKKKLRLLAFSQLDSQAHDARGAMLYKCLIDRWKSPFVPYGIAAISLCRCFNMPVQLNFFNFLRESS